MMAIARKALILLSSRKSTLAEGQAFTAQAKRVGIVGSSFTFRTTWAEQEKTPRSESELPKRGTVVSSDGAHDRLAVELCAECPLVINESNWIKSDRQAECPCLVGEAVAWAPRPLVDDDGRGKGAAADGILRSNTTDITLD